MKIRYSDIFLLILATGLAALGCSEAKACDTYFPELQQKALEQFPEFTSQINLMTLEQGTPPAGADAATYNNENIVYSSRLCNFPSIHIRSVIAHEIGHVIAAATYPTINTIKDETLANIFGARLLAQQERTELVDYSQAKCDKGIKSYCAWAIDWAYAFTQ